jgi:hypothetical protein
MKMFLIAVAMATAAPAAAQSTTATSVHSGHAAHAAQPAQSPHADCCRRNAEGRMACCEGMAGGNGRGCCGAEGTQTPGSDPHAGHDMSGDAHAGHGTNQN